MQERILAVVEKVAEVYYQDIYIKELTEFLKKLR